MHRLAVCTLSTFWVAVAVCSVPHVTFMGETLVNHSYVEIDRVRNSDGGSNSIQCNSSSSDDTVWYFPNSTRLPYSNESHDGIYQHQVSSRVDIRLTTASTPPIGMYYCETSTAGVGNIKSYVGLFNSSRGQGIKNVLFYSESSFMHGFLSIGSDSCLTSVTYHDIA